MSDFKILSQRDHCRQRPGMYVGSTSLEQYDRFLNGKWSSVYYVPAIVKMVDEIIDNSIDEAIRTKFKHSNTIEVSVEKTLIRVTDNGRGIPQDDVIDSNAKKILRPVAAWTQMNAGTSFEDDRVTIGANGLGSAAVNFMSSTFVGSTSNGKTKCIVTCKNGILENVEKQNSDKKGTSVTFEPDLSLFNIHTLDEFDLSSIVLDRLKSLSVCFPKIRFYFDGTDVTTNLKKFSYSFVTNEANGIVHHNKGEFRYFFCHSGDGFRTTSYVNGVNTRQGGSLVDEIVNSVSDELIVLIKKKHKIDITRSLIKSCLTFVSFANGFPNPKFDSQTKERLTNSKKEVQEYLAANKYSDCAKIAKEIFDTDSLINPIIEAQLAKKLANEKRLATQAMKKAKKAKIAKHIPANKEGGTLFVCEGLSALGFGCDVRNPDKHGFYPLKGVVMNTWNAPISKIIANQELSDLMAILSLDIRKKDMIGDMHYEEIAIMSDADVDGSHIAILLIGFFRKYWPSLIEQGKLKWLRTPIMISSKGKDTKWFYSYDDANAFKNVQDGYTHRYIKGLASLRKDEYSKIINDPVFATIDVRDSELLEAMLGDDSNKRKDWITT